MSITSLPAEDDADIFPTDFQVGMVVMLMPWSVLLQVTKQSAVRHKSSSSVEEQT